MSSHVLQRLHEQGALTPQQFADLTHLQPHSGYAYYDQRELNYTKLRMLLRMNDPRIVQAFLDDLLPSDWAVTQLPGELDIDGDGDVDTDDALKQTTDALRNFANLIESIRASGYELSDDERREIAEHVGELIQRLCATRQIVDHIQSHRPRRKRAKRAPAYATPKANGQPTAHPNGQGEHCDGH